MLIDSLSITHKSRFAPFPDMIAVPDFNAGAMENWGLITYREAYMIYTKGVSSAEDKKQIGRIVAHELAHQVCCTILVNLVEMFQTLDSF